MKTKGIAAATAVCACALYFTALGASPAFAVKTELCTNIAKGQPTFVWHANYGCKEPPGIIENYHRVITGGSWLTRLLWGEGESEFLSAGTFSATIAGTKLTVACSKLTNSSGVAENVEELGVEKVKGKEMVMVYSQCKVTAPAEKGCKVAEPITTAKLKTTAAEEAGTTKEWLEPESGTRIATLSISGCSISALNGEKELTGTMVGVVPSAETEQCLLEFTTTSGSSLKLAGSSATYTGSTEAEAEATVEGKKASGVLFIGE